MPAGGKLQKEKGKFREKERWGWVGRRGVRQALAMFGRGALTN